MRDESNGLNKYHYGFRRRLAIGKLAVFLILLSIITPLVATGCQSKEERREVIKQLADAQAKKKDQSETISEKIVENMKENSKKQYEQIFDVQEQAEKDLTKGLNNDLSFEEETDRIVDNLGGMGWRTFFRIIFTMSDNALPGSFICIVVGLIFSWLFRNNKIAFKFYLAIAIVGPILFLLSVYLPPAMIQFYK